MVRARWGIALSCLVALTFACGSGRETGSGAGGAAGSGVPSGGASGDASVSGTGGESGEAGADAAGAANESCPTAGSPRTRLSVSEAQILDPSGTPIQLRGWNWGQWGSAQPQDAADNAAQGANVVRIPLRWWGYYDNQDANADPVTRVDSRSDDEPGHIESGHLRALDQMIHDAACHKLWVVLFLDSNCGQASATGDTAAYCGTASDGNPANFTNSPSDVETFTQVWEFLVARYRDQPFMGMYELLPEPHLGCPTTPCSNWDAAPAFYAPIIKRVRAIDPSTPILIGPDGGYEIKQIATAHVPDVSGLIYTGDFLDGAAGHPEYIRYATDFQTNFHAPVFIQQVGSRKEDADPDVRATTILEAMNAAQIGWTWWTYRETKSATGKGFAPYWEDNGPPWHEDEAWLRLISDQFR